MAKRYLDDEVKNGFYIPAIMKQCFAAELEVLKEVDKLCQKYDITYFAEWGTLLGAIRHGGFIPWDDDLDISMKRADYEKFLQVSHELPAGFEVQNLRNKNDFDKFLANVIGKSRICFEPEHLEKFHGFPYIAGLDIFVLDYVSKDEEKEKLRDAMANYLIVLADNIFDGRVKKRDLSEHLLRVETGYGIKFDRSVFAKAGNSLEGNCEVRQYLYTVAEKMLGEFSKEESKELVQLVPCGLLGNDQNMPKEYYDQTIRVPFENTTIPVPYRYEDILSHRYGDYMKIVKNVAGHDYPCFAIQQENLSKVADLGGYQYDQTPIREKLQEEIADAFGDSYKEMLQKAAVLLTEITNEFSYSYGADYLSEMQQLALDMGNLIESVCGEGTETVSHLEEICEQIYNIFEIASQEVAIKSNPEQEKKISFMLGELKLKILIFIDCMQDEVLDRKEVVFCPTDASFFERYEAEYQKAAHDPKCRVYVIPIPTYRKTYDMQLVEESYSVEGYPKWMTLTDYREFDFALHHPEKIYIQSPYDEFNPTSSVHPFFYSSNLVKFARELIYIPYFQTDDFTPESERAYLNMKHYVTMPGVVNADKVILDSKTQKDTYIRKLMDWAGEETKEVWEKKILVKEAIEKKTELINQNSSTDQKHLLYYIALGPLLGNPEKMLAKIRKNLEIFEEHKENVQILYKTDANLEVQLQKVNPKLYEEYMEVVQNMDRVELEDEALVSYCDAYYGNAGYLANMFRDHKKPVMLQNIQI